MRLIRYLGPALLVLFFLVAIFGPLFAPFHPFEKNLAEQLAFPSSEHWLGQNQHGEDLFSILLWGARGSLIVGCCTILSSASMGVTVGLLSGYIRGKVDALSSAVIEVILSFPGTLLALAIAAVLGPSLRNVVIALSLSGWVPFARLTRGLVLSLREREYVTAARAMGASTKRILFRHILPQLTSPILVQSTYAFAAAILAESSLSFLGVGAPPGTPSWGGALSDGVRYLFQAPHLATFPGLAIMLSVLALNLTGDQLRDSWNER